MESVSKVISVPREIDIAGTMYKVGELTLADFAKLEQWSKQQITSRVLAAARDAGLSVKELSEIARIKISQEELQDEFESISAMRQMVYIALCKNNSKERAKEAVDKAGISEIGGIVEILTGEQSKNVTGPAAEQ